jgi:hypothetical protein
MQFRRVYIGRDGRVIDTQVGRCLARFANSDGEASIPPFFADMRQVERELLRLFGRQSRHLVH